MFTYEYNESIYYINMRNIAYIKISDMNNIWEPGDIGVMFENNKWGLTIYYMNNLKTTFVFDTQEEAIELAEKLYAKNSSV